MELATIAAKAHELFREAPFIAHIHNDDDYRQALALMDELIDDYDDNRTLIEVLEASIERWEETSEEFADFNARVAGLDDVAVLKLLMEQHGLGIADLPEIGSKSLVSKILNGRGRHLTRNHIQALSQRFDISPALFFHRH
ncbi:hypothetical protein L861_10090 [Litchfieldella anticariensis FP35 = DSM 16096]|uniref:Transcriptional regulator n=1 Tax=Litchfieldella anticariensis (strain DSM 16096 / CECT 5854 / CIP 108499 / LMG 22089 / FP35) TaxID=1121939 RepID=S2KL69_LITA3|nr:transcriptional regulator [Halomonas anticariensis]EPC02685.1 hypothetical protein L861_10090 [Halomonas anticariensis FP35 = DSM 16096]